jgi:hypothetical protein
MENIGIVYGHLRYITAFWYILWSFGNLGVIWYMFPLFWYIVSRKIWQPWWGTVSADPTQEQTGI